MYTVEFYKLALNHMMWDVFSATTLESVEISVLDLLSRFGDYPGRMHSVPDCCKAMRAALKHAREG